MDFISVTKKHSPLGSIIHTILNIAFVFAVWFSIWATKRLDIAIILVLISKWRTLAVRPRYWFANIKSNMVDVIFSLGISSLMFVVREYDFYIQADLIFAYIAWIIFIKPLSSKFWMKIQALVSVFVGVSAVYVISGTWNSAFVVFLGFLVGYASFRHVLSSGKSSNIDLLSLFWGMIFAEICWMLNYFVVGYRFFGLKDILIPQASVVLTLISFLGAEFIEFSRKKSKHNSEILLPAFFVILTCCVILIGFSVIIK